ncbi:MAG: hypothetical protein AAFX50_23725, partial [Acidobacteriota bacterium]
MSERFTVPRQGAPGSGPTLVEWLERAAAAPDCGLRFLDRRERATFVPWAEIYRGAGKVAASLHALG